jgi:hypothetical protein
MLQLTVRINYSWLLSHRSHLAASLQTTCCSIENLCRDFWAFHSDCPLKGRNKILASICPQIYGLFLVKLAVALTLIGGCARQDDSGAHIRGEVHMLLIGDPGTGKSQVSGGNLNPARTCQ